MNKPKYQIGDVVWTGEWKSYEKWEKCPDCGGTRTLKVTLFDNTEYIIPCEGCKRGYEGPYGVVKHCAYHAVVRELVIQGMELGCFSNEKDIWQYKLGLEGSCYRQVPEHELFMDEQAALNFAIAKGRQLEIDEAARVLMKEKPEKSWAWHVTYHRHQIKEAQRNLIYHTEKLNAATVKVRRWQRQVREEK
jgi:hypothetical protein